MRISDWSSDVCSSDLFEALHHRVDPKAPGVTHDIPCRDQRSAKEAKQSAQRLAGRDSRLSNFAEHSAARCDIGAAHVARLPGFSHDFGQPFSVLYSTTYSHVPVARRPVDQPGTTRADTIPPAELLSRHAHPPPHH